MPPPSIQRSEPGLAGFTAALKTISNYEARRGDLAARLKTLQQDTDPAARAKAAELAAQPVAPPPFDALLIGETGPTLVQAADILPFYDAACGPNRSTSSASCKAPGTRPSTPPRARASSPPSRANTARRRRPWPISPSMPRQSPACSPARTISPPPP
jgi:hypothetical protein